MAPQELRATAVVSVLVAVLACSLFVQAVGFAGTVTAAGAGAQEDGDPPRLAAGERINDTAVRLVFTDDTGVATESIDPSDFILSSGEVAGVSTVTDGTDAIVTVRLTSPVNADTLTVGLGEGSDIRDVDGNTLETDGFVGVDIDGMDSVPPSVRRLSVPGQVSDQATVELVFDEAVRTFEVRLSGTRSAEFGPADFDRVRTGKYVLRYVPPEDGLYTVEVVGATDTAGNSVRLAQAGSMEVRTTDIEASAGVDLSASSGLNLTFDASGSTDALEYVWEFGDGETAAGRRVSHQFRPGNYTVELRVIDQYGNVGTDQVQVDLAADGIAGFVPGGDTNESSVTVDRSDPDRPTDAQVVVSQMQPDRPFLVRASAAGDPLVTTTDFALEELTITPAASGGFGLGLSAVGLESDTLSSARSETGGTPIGGYIARPTVADDALSSVEVRFTVRRDRLSSIGVGPDAVTLYRESDGAWEPQETTLVSPGADRFSFEATTAGFSRFAVLVEPQEPPDDTDNGADPGSDNETQTETEPDDQTTDDTGGDNATEPTQIQVTNVTLSDDSVGTGEEFVVEGLVQNQGEEPADYVAGLEIDGETVKTQEVLRIPPDGETLPVTFTHRVNESGTVTVGINGTAGPDLTVGSDGGGGGLFGFLGFLGFLPLGLLRTLLMFVVAPLAVLVVVLKGVASYMGY